MMTSNQLTPDTTRHDAHVRTAHLRRGTWLRHGRGGCHGTGAGGSAAVSRRHRHDRLAGAYGGWWQADPNDRSVLIFLAHNMVELHQMARGIGLGVWSAIATFHQIAIA